MKHSDFEIGAEFWSGARRWRCTDKGSRVVVAIRVDGADVVRKEEAVTSTTRLSAEEAEREGWFSGPPYAVAEVVFDEHDIEGCTREAPAS
jgi:hypothetical protein